ncbi:MAG: maleylpyruvate isomerase N-terminal domain-containing protein [Cryobacterium sp.]|nr:maleylpyruvate isomerase N-terminal domain-containing protein [Cryobacterium sp.]
MKNVAVFEDAARAFIDVLGRITDKQWDEPGLGEWTVRSLAGHTARAISTVGEYLNGSPPTTVTCPDAEAYYAGLHGSSGSSAAVAARGVAAGAELGDDPVPRVTTTLDTVLAAIAAQPANRIVSVIGGRAIPLAEYLRTRTFELVVHTMDLTRATGIRHSLPQRAISDAAALAARIASLSGNGDTLLLALTGRIALPEGFSVV